ncbi:hypothetical protein MKD05_09100 [[Clostridium] innocuum]|nr:hypothetical protein [[Clostridium] innocuum]
MDEMMSGTAFDARLNVLWERFFALQNHAGADVQETLHDLMTHPKEELDDASYMKLMYMKGLCYEEQGNKNAARYCAMRMYAIQECMRNPRKKRPRFLDLQGYACSDAMNAFIERYTAFLEETYRGINRRLLMIVGILFLAVFLVLTLFLKIYFIIAALESIMLGMLTYLLQKRRMPDIFQKNQLNAIEKYVEQEVLEFDRPIRFS